MAESESAEEENPSSSNAPSAKTACVASSIPTTATKNGAGENMDGANPSHNPFNLTPINIPETSSISLGSPTTPAATTIADATREASTFCYGEGCDEKGPSHNPEDDPENKSEEKNNGPSSQDEDPKVLSTAASVTAAASEPASPSASRGATSATTLSAQAASSGTRDRSGSSAEAASALLATAMSARAAAAFEGNRGYPAPTSNRFLNASDSLPSSLHSALNPTAVAAVSNSPAERRGSGFLLLAAEAYEAAERTQLRADAIRQVALELANAAATANPSSPSGSEAAAARDVILQRSATSFLQGLATGQAPAPQSPMFYPSFPPSNSSAFPEIDGRFREQVYMAAARMQQQQAQAAPAAAATATSPREEAQDEAASSKGKKRKLSEAAAAKKSEPPLPRAPLVPPTKKQPSTTKKSRRRSTLEEDDVDNASNDSGSSDENSHKLLPSGKPRPKPLKHVYHDYSSIPDSEHFVRKKTGGVTMPFPEKLMNMLDKESLLHPDAVSWLSHGRAFIVRKPKIFTSEIMGGYFRQSKLTSFQRQLNLYGFRRITQAADAGAYYHELFLRGRPQLCMRMQRQKVKGTGHKQPTDVTSEPNFYGMPALSDTVENEGDVTMEDGGDESDGKLPPIFPPSSAPPPLAPPDGTLNTALYPRHVASPTPASISDLYNSPGLTATAMLLRRLSGSNIAAPPFVSLGVSAMAAAFQDSANANAAAAAMADMGNGSDSSSRRSSAASMEYV